MNPPFEILFEDNHLLIVNKPAGMLTQPTETEQESALQQLKNWIKQRDNKPKNVFLEAIFRLDKPVSGIVVFAKTQKALSRLHAETRNRKTKKTYLALTETEGLSITSTWTTVQHYLTHDAYRANVVSKEDPGAKLAILHFRILKIEKYALWEISLETGRYHQIRAQLSAIGYPILGYAKYGSKISLPTIALHHAEFQFEHPVRKEMVKITSEPHFKID